MLPCCAGALTRVVYLLFASVLLACGPAVERIDLAGLQDRSFQVVSVGPVQLSELQGSHATLYFILAPDCPMCRNYARFLSTFPAQDSIQAIGIFPTEFIPVDSVLAFQKEFDLQMPLIMDPEAELAAALHAKVTPTAFLIDRHGKVLYQGAIDNWATRPGKKRIAATAHYLKDALKAVRTGQAPKLAMVEPVGCIIEYDP